MSLLRYTLVVVHPESLTPVALLAGKPVPAWAQGLVHDDDYEDRPASKAAEPRATASSRQPKSADS